MRQDASHGLCQTSKIALNHYVEAHYNSPLGGTKIQMASETKRRRPINGTGASPSALWCRSAGGPSGIERTPGKIHGALKDLHFIRGQVSVSCRIKPG